MVDWKSAPHHPNYSKLVKAEVNQRRKWRRNHLVFGLLSGTMLRELRRAFTFLKFTRFAVDD